MAERAGSVRKAADNAIPAQGVTTDSAADSERAGVVVTGVAADADGAGTGKNAGTGNVETTKATAKRAPAVAVEKVTARTTAVTGPRSKAASKAGPPAKSAAKAQRRRHR